MNLLIHRLPDCWECVPSAAGLRTGVGQSPLEAVGNCVAANPEYFGVNWIRYDVQHELTRFEVEKRDLEISVAQRKGIPLTFSYGNG